MSGRVWRLPGVTRIVAIASTPRTGSNLLAMALGATGSLPAPMEWLNPKAFELMLPGRPTPMPRLERRVVRRLGRSLGAQSLASISRFSPNAVHRYMVDMCPSRTAADGTMTLKVMWPHYEQAVIECGLAFEHLAVPVVWLRTTRRDRLLQAVSLARALSSWKWTSEAVSRTEEVYESALIDRCLVTIASGEQGWDGYFAALGVTPFEVVYEDLDDRYEDVVRAALRHCAIDAPVPPRQLERQRDSITDEWLERYCSERGVERD